MSQTMTAAEPAAGEAHVRSKAQALSAISIDHRSAPIALRERLTLPTERRRTPLPKMSRSAGWQKLQLYLHPRALHSHLPRNRLLSCVLRAISRSTIVPGLWSRGLRSVATSPAPCCTWRIATA